MLTDGGAAAALAFASLLHPLRRRPRSLMPSPQHSRQRKFWWLWGHFLRLRCCICGVTCCMSTVNDCARPPSTMPSVRLLPRAEGTSSKVLREIITWASKKGPPTQSGEIPDDQRSRTHEAICIRVPECPDESRPQTYFFRRAFAKFSSFGMTWCLELGTYSGGLPKFDFGSS